MGSFLNFNGQLIDKKEFQLPFPNRAFRYGDGFFEAMRVVNGEILLLKYNLERIEISAKTIQLTNLPSSSELTSQLQNLIKKENELNARLRLSFFRDSEGTYTPNQNNALWLAEIDPMSTTPFKLNDKGLKVGFYPERVKLTHSKLSNIKTLSSAGYVLAGLYMKENNWDDCIILNSENRPCEFYSSNLYIIKDGNIYTPPLDEGCLLGSSRMFLQDTLGKKLIEQPLQKQDILAADEVFLSSSIRGIQWVEQIEDSIYKCDRTIELHHRVMKSIGL